MADDFPTARNMLRQDGWLCCSPGAKRATISPDLQAIVDAGRGDEPLKDLKFRCTECGSSRTDHVLMSRDALAVRPKYQRFVR